MLYDFLQLDYHLAVPLYKQLYESVKSAIQNGQLKKNTRLLSIRKAASELNVSRTTVETAYNQLCIEGYIENKPQKGYYVRELSYFINKERKEKSIQKEDNIIYDFGSSRIDSSAADITLWKKHLRGVLNRQKEITSYGEPQGEYALREALSEYSYISRGVHSNPDNIVIGAGIQPLFTLLCGLLDKCCIAIESPGFKQAEQIFNDFGFPICHLPGDADGILPKELEESNADILLDLPSNRPKSNASTLTGRRDQLLKWLKSKPGAFILEDDYNGELRYRARPLPALQGMNRERIIYLGSFSKLLLPSVRISYMVLPEVLLKEYKQRSQFYNQTASKIEQLALAEYILQGHLEKHLRRLRKLYYTKSQMLYSALENNLKGIMDITLLETSLSIILTLKSDATSKELCISAAKAGILVSPTSPLGGHTRVVLSFAGISKNEIAPGIEALNKAWKDYLY
ncbi:PLP-dependent aminotransferase family protein [Clostridium polynesiense]|uniref:MocR-like pyridoxine biosynthesis transcription factor PdxR n=1 Tax=Clostridium polynesiense TaxID=1325933 RepID=UPI000693E357|nr:PLP-dependent aminotransferase family protein [Clostridium polynesiense]